MVNALSYLQEVTCYLMGVMLLFNSICISPLVLHVYLTLDLNDLGDIQEEILKASTKWYNIGLKLGVAVHVLDAIKLLPPGNFGDQLLEMLKCWLKTAQLPTRKDLIDALRAPAVGEFWLASELEKKYCCTRESEPGVHPGESSFNSI